MHPLDLSAPVVPGTSAAGFAIGQRLDDIVSQIDDDIADVSEECLNKIVDNNRGWIRASLSCGDSCLVYSRDVVSLSFNADGVLFSIDVGEGYQQGYCGILPGDALKPQYDSLEVRFSSDDDDYYVVQEGTVLDGIRVISDFRGPLEEYEHQLVKFICVVNYKLL